MTEQQTPTPIDPADIRPGDVVEYRKRVNVARVDSDGWIFASNGMGFTHGGGTDTWHLIHRPDPDAEAVEALAKCYFDMTHPDADDLEVSRISLGQLRRLGFDVVKRAGAEKVGYQGRFSHVIDRAKGIATCMDGDPHPAHEWHYTDEGGGHMIELPGPDDKQWTCPGRTKRAES